MWNFIYDFKFSPDLTANLIRSAGANNQFIVQPTDGLWAGATGAGDGPATYQLTFNVPYSGVLELSVGTVDSGETYGLFKINGSYAYPDIATVEQTAPNNLRYDQNGTFQWVVENVTTFEVRFLGATGRANYQLVLYENIKQAFQRVYKSDPLGQVAFEDLDFNGAPYTPQALVAKCTAQYDEQILCDVILSQATNNVPGNQTNQASINLLFEFANGIDIIATASNTNANTTLETTRSFYMATRVNTTWTVTFTKPVSGQIKLLTVDVANTLDFGSLNGFNPPPDESTFAETAPGTGNYDLVNDGGAFTWLDVKNITQISWNEVVGPNQTYYRLYLFLPYVREFVRHFVLDTEDNLTYFDTDEDGNFYAVLGTPQSCNAELQESATLESWIWEITTGETWDVNDIPSGYTLTGMTMVVMNKGENNDNYVANQDFNIISNLDTGLSLSWGAEDRNILVPPMQISAGTGASSRIVVHATLRRNDI